MKNVDIDKIEQLLPDWTIYLGILYLELHKFP